MNSESSTSSHVSTYLETEVITATPQRLRLMLIQAAISTIEQTLMLDADGNSDTAASQLPKLREIVVELISGISPQGGPLAEQVADLYQFIYREIVATQVDLQISRLATLLPVLAEDRTTWQQLCEQLPHRVQRTDSTENEILAPRFVGEIQGLSDAPASSFASQQLAGSSFSFDA